MRHSHRESFDARAANDHMKLSIPDEDVRGWEIALKGMDKKWIRAFLNEKNPTLRSKLAQEKFDKAIKDAISKGEVSLDDLAKLCFSTLTE